MGALSVVICAILSHFFLKESLTFFVRPSSEAIGDQLTGRDGSGVRCV
jgi:hypothetical protein